jgi:hypothetical protein
VSISWRVCWLGFACLACALQASAASAADVFNVNTPGRGAEIPSAALQNLYQLAAQMTADPSPGYDRHTSRWPRADQIQQQWVASVSVNGNNLTPEQRRQMIPCAAHLNSAIDFMERGYRIEISQKNNPPAQRSAQNLYAKGRMEFALCDGQPSTPAKQGDNPPATCLEKPTIGAKTATGEDLIQAAYQFFRSQGFTKWGAAYMTGSLMWESQGLNPDVRQLDGGPGYGLAQWTDDKDHRSYTALLAYAEKHNRPKSDFTTQMHFVVQQRTKITQEFKDAKTEAQAKAAVMHFENYKVEGTGRYRYAETICQNVVCSQEPPSRSYDDPKIGVSAGKGLGYVISPKLGCGTDLGKLIQDLRSPWTEPN